MMIRTSTLLSLMLCTVIATDAVAQRRRPGQSTRKTTSAPTASPKEDAKKEDEGVKAWTLIHSADVYIGNGTLLRRASILLADDKISAVGYDLEMPDDTEVKSIDAKGKVISPGFCIVKAAGLGAPRSASATIKDELNPYDTQIKLGLAAGITSFMVRGGANSRTPSGKSAVVKLAFGDLDGMLLEQDTVASMNVPLDPQRMRDLRKLIKDVREYREKRDAAKGKKEEKGKKPLKAPRSGETILRILDGKTKLWIGMGRGPAGNAAIRQALEISNLLESGIVLDNPVTAWAIPDEIAATGSMAIVNPRNQVKADPSDPENTGSNPAMCAILEEHGVQVAVTCPSGRFGGAQLGTGGILGQDLNTPFLDAAFAVRGGMDNRKALRTLTLDAAKIMGVEKRIGSIEAGKDADLLILTGDPLHYKTLVETAIVNGKIVYERANEPFFRHIKR